MRVTLVTVPFKGDKHLEHRGTKEIRETEPEGSYTLSQGLGLLGGGTVCNRFSLGAQKEPLSHTARFYTLDLQIYERIHVCCFRLLHYL